MEKTKDKFLQEQEKSTQNTTTFNFLFDAYYFDGQMCYIKKLREDLEDEESK